MDKIEKIKRSGAFRRRVQIHKNINRVLSSACAADEDNTLAVNRDFQRPRPSLSSDTCTVTTTDEGNTLAVNLDFQRPSRSSDTCTVTTEAIDQVENLEIEDSDSDLEAADSNYNFREELRQWSIGYNVPHTAINALLHIINTREPNLVPKDARTLLHTTKSVEIKACGSGEYWHNGLKTNILQYMEKCNEHITININVNIDGLPTYKSSKVEFWPILCKIHEISTVPVMVIGIYCGKGKPDANSFLEPFVTELKEVLQNGLEINNYLIKVKLRAFICDSPARAFIKNIANFNSQNGCPKCTAVGEYSYESHCNVYPRRDFPERTDEGFRNKIYESHHKGDTILTELPIDMILDFPVSDSLHLIDLGIAKRCLLGWRDGSFRGYRTKWSANDIANISGILINCKLPKEIHRAVRGLDCLAFWKASEFSTFVHYLGLVILKKFLQPDAYDHFLLLVCATTICSSNVYSGLLNVAELMLKHYIEYYGDIYGEAHITSNVHNLSHIVQEVRRFGPLQSFNAYAFENELYTIKRLLRTGSKPLQQAAKRILERQKVPVVLKSSKESDYIKLKKNIESRPGDFDNSLLPQGERNQSEIKFYAHVEFKDFTLNRNHVDAWFVTTDNIIVKFVYAVSVNTTKYCCGLPLKKCKQFFSRPIQSCHLNIYVSDLQTLENVIICEINQLKCKLVVVSYSTNEHVFIPLIHTLKL